MTLSLAASSSILSMKRPPINENWRISYEDQDQAKTKIEALLGPAIGLPLPPAASQERAKQLLKRQFIVLYLQNRFINWFKLPKLFETNYRELVNQTVHPGLLEKNKNKELEQVLTDLTNLTNDFNVISKNAVLKTLTDVGDVNTAKKNVSIYFNAIERYLMGQPHDNAEKQSWLDDSLQFMKEHLSPGMFERVEENPYNLIRTIKEEKEKFQKAASKTTPGAEAAMLKEQLMTLNNDLMALADHITR